MIKKILLIVLAVLSGMDSFAYPFIWKNDLAGRFYYYNPNTMGQIVTGPVTVSGIGCTASIDAVLDAYMAMRWSTTTMMDTSTFFWFRVASRMPGPLSMYISDMGLRNSSTVPMNYAIRSSVDNYTADLNTGTIPPSYATGPTRITSDLVNSTTSDTIELRLYAWGAKSIYDHFGVTDFQISGTTALPVHFGAISAHVTKQNKISVRWETINEFNNDHFNIEASADGETFIPIASIKSKALRGQSSTSLQYEYIFGVPVNLAVNLSAAILALVCSPLFKRKHVIGKAVIMLLVIAFLFFSCNKNDTLSVDRYPENLYMRIGQVDADGTMTYSKVVKVIKE